MFDHFLHEFDCRIILAGVFFFLWFYDYFGEHYIVRREFDIDSLISGAYFDGFGDISDGRENERSSVSPCVELIFSVNIGDSTHFSLVLIIDRDIH